MPLTAYLDTNVFQDLREQRRGLTRNHDHKIRDAVRRQRLCIVVGFPVIAETLAIWAYDEFKARKTLKYVLNIARLKPCRAKLVKEPRQLLKEAICAYAHGTSQPGPWCQLDLRSFLQPTVEQSAELQQAAREHLCLLQQFQGEMQLAAKTVLEQLGFSPDKGLPIKARQRQPFDQFFHDFAPAMACALARGAGVSNSKAQQIAPKLLKLSVVRVACGVAAARAYDAVINHRAPQPSDVMDMHHAVCAAASTTILVTGDQDFIRVVRQIPGCPLEAITVEELLARL